MRPSPVPAPNGLQKGRSLWASLTADREWHRRRMLAVCAGAMAFAGFVAPVAVSQLVDPAPAAWAPYLVAPVAAAFAWWLETRGRRSAAVATVAVLGILVTAQSGVRDVTSVTSALYLIPIAMFVVSFVDTQGSRRKLLASMLFAVLAQRLLRAWVGLDPSVDAWLEGTFHSVAITSLFAVLLEVMHHHHTTDRRSLRKAYEDMSLARMVADEEAEAAVQASHSTSTFLEAMSHELRTPLNAVVGYAELLVDEEPREAHREDLERIRGAGMHMVELVDEVLDVSKVESGREQRYLGSVDVRELLRASADLARPLLRPGVLLRMEVGRGVGAAVTDAQKLRQIILNLLSNAARFTERGTVTLRATQDADALAIEVQDTGIGMDPARVDGLFEAFAQADHRYGTGLGLALCARFAELLGGRIDVDTALGLGSRFTVTLPLGDHALPSGPSVDLPEPSLVPPPRSPLEDRVGQWLDVGTLAGVAFSVVTGVLVMLGLVPSHLGLPPYIVLVMLCGGAFALARSGRRRIALGVFVASALGINAYSYVFHAHAQASVLYLCVVAAYVALVVHGRSLHAILGAGGLAAVAMLALRHSQGHDTPEMTASTAFDTLLIYSVTSVLLSMWVHRHRQEESALAKATFDIDRLRSHATTLAHAATSANQAKSSFVAAMSHELRSPLNAILGYTALLEDEWPDDDPGIEDLALIRAAGQSLLALINEVLDLARVRAGRMPMALEPIDVVEVAATVGLDVHGEADVYADRHLLERALTLLVERGAKHLELRKGTVHTRLPGTPRAGENPVDPLAYDPCLGRPGAGWALLSELCRAQGGMLMLEAEEGVLAVGLWLPPTQLRSPDLPAPMPDP